MSFILGIISNRNTRKSIYTINLFYYKNFFYQETPDLILYFYFIFKILHVRMILIKLPLSSSFGNKNLLKAFEPKMTRMKIFKIIVS